jgi:RNA polymerase sigma-70 factor, ECF subfamily
MAPSDFLMGVAGQERQVADTPATADVEALYRKEADRLWRALLGFTRDPEVASDAMAEAFAQLLGRLEAVRSPDRWLWRAAFRIASGEMKRMRQREPLVDQVYEVPETARNLLEALGSLSAKQRGAVVLHHYGGYSVREVAEILGSTPSAVKVHLFRGRRRLRELLRGEHGRAD